MNNSIGVKKNKTFYYSCFECMPKTTRTLTEITEEESNRDGSSENSQVHELIGRHCSAGTETQTQLIKNNTHQTTVTGNNKYTTDQVKLDENNNTYMHTNTTQPIRIS